MNIANIEIIEDKVVLLGSLKGFIEASQLVRKGCPKSAVLTMAELNSVIHQLEDLAKTGAGVGLRMTEVWEFANESYYRTTIASSTGNIRLSGSTVIYKEIK